MVLNINRESMASVGYSPPTRIFEAAGSGACVITDFWTGIDAFFAPETEILIATSAEQVVSHLRTVTPGRVSEIGRSMRQRALKEHTYPRRARQVDATLKALAVEIPA
jgi:spore maturation protein CgeB